jgi:beta-galactosidase
MTGWRRPISHYRSMLWNDNEPLYMAVKEPNGYHGKIYETSWSVWPTWESWNWAGWEGKHIDVEVYTKAPEVKLYLNDQLVGSKKVSRDTEFKAVFTLPYEAGTLRAEAGDESVSLATAGEPAKLRLTADRTKLTADGQSLAYITVEVVDKEGRVCPDAAIPCEAIVKGQATLMAFASADLKDREIKTSPRATTFKGRAIIVVRSTHKKGKVQVIVKSCLPDISLTIG